MVDLNLSARLEAISKLAETAGASFKLQGDEIVEWSKGEKPTEAEIQTEIDAVAYARARKPLYPDIGDQLDDLYHKGAFSAEMAAKIKKVKDDNPKG